MTSDDMKNTAKDIADRIEEKSSDARSSAKNATAKASDAARDFAAQTSDTATDVYARAQGHIRDAADRLPDASDAVAAGQRAYSKSSETVSRHVSKQPLEALLLAGAIGYLVGWATNRS